MFVKPGHLPDGTPLKVRIPRTHALLPDEGADVPEDQFWLRRLSQGDVVRAEPSAALAAEPQH